MCGQPSQNWSRLAVAEALHQRQRPRHQEAKPQQLKPLPVEDKRWTKLAPSLIVKKKAAHGGHHGGAWKVAYADFVTAMMALFIVLWLMNSSEKIKEAISAYFNDPSGTGKHSGSASTGTGETVSVNKDNMADLKNALE